MDKNPISIESGDTSPLSSDRSSGSELFEDLSEEVNAAKEQRKESEDVKSSHSAELTSNKLIDDIDNNLPETVSLLTNEHGAKVYLVGTAHFSEESQNDVSHIIQAVQPNIVVVELCNSRLNILQLDEETILREAKEINFEKVMRTIRQNGVMNGLMYILLLNTSAHITKELGMAPGGEFRTAFKEVKKIPNCVIHLGDRPISITLQRALASLSWWQSAKLAWHLLTFKEPIKKEDVEKCKRKDLLEELISEMAGEFPAIGEVFLKERDIYLTHSLQIASTVYRHGNLVVPKVVGVVGIGHVPGITRLWPIRQHENVNRIMQIPPKSLTSKLLKLSIRFGMLALIGYAGYKCVPIIFKVKNNVVDVIKSKYL